MEGKRKMMNILKPGLLTTVQDIGRYGFQRFGVIASGAMDPVAHRIANLLVGNSEFTPTIEITMIGPAIEFTQDSLVAICGGNLAPEIDGIPLRPWRPIFIKKGSILRFVKRVTGCRAYLSVAGGIQIPSVMNSSSTYLRAAIGGFEGRPLKKGDQILFGPMGQLSGKIFSSLKNRDPQGRKLVEANWSVAAELIPDYSGNPVIQVIKGRHFHLFDKESQKKFFSEPYTVTTESDRMGYRIRGTILKLNHVDEMVSEAVAFGTVQVPADGNPIVLLADRQTTGGYPKIAQVASVDLPLIAQAMPGDSLRFVEISHNLAQELLIEREMTLAELKIGIAWKFR
jgi:antagonist of KipI